MTLTSKIQKVRDALKGITGINLYHYWRPNMQPPFLVWAETGEATSFDADNGKREQAIEGTADYYTLTEYDSTIDAIQSAINTLGGGWVLLSVEYEDVTKLIHYSWTWRIR